MKQVSPVGIQTEDRALNGVEVALCDMVNINGEVGSSRRPNDVWVPRVDLSTGQHTCPVRRGNSPNHGTQVARIPGMVDKNDWLTSPSVSTTNQTDIAWPVRDRGNSRMVNRPQPPCQHKRTHDVWRHHLYCRQGVDSKIRSQAGREAAQTFEVVGDASIDRCAESCGVLPGMEPVKDGELIRTWVHSFSLARIADRVVPMSKWRKPGLYAVVAALVGAVATSVSSWEIEKRRTTDNRDNERLPPGGLIVVANHTSLADGIFLALVGVRLGRPLRLLGTAGIIEAPVLGRLSKKLGFIAVHRNSTNPASALEPAAAALRAGDAIALYPEGRITRHAKHWPERAKTGAVRLALMTDSPVVPVASVGAEKVISRRRSDILRGLVVNLVKRPPVRINVGDPINVRLLIGLAPNQEPTSEEIRLAADQVMAILIKMVEELRGERAPDPLGVERDRPSETTETVLPLPNKRRIQVPFAKRRSFNRGDKTSVIKR